MKYKRLQLVILLIIMEIVCPTQSQDDEADSDNEICKDSYHLMIGDAKPNYDYARNLLENCSCFNSPENISKAYDCCRKVIECCELICPTDDCSIEVTNLQARALEEIEWIEKFIEHPSDVGQCSCNLKEIDISVLSKYNSIILKNSDDAAAANDRGVFWGKKCCYKEALESFNESILINPHLAEPWYNKGVLLYYEEPIRALECFNRSVKINPEFGLAWFNRCSLLLSFDSDMNSLYLREAKTSCDKAVQLRPELACYIPPNLEYQRIA